MKHVSYVIVTGLVISGCNLPSGISSQMPNNSDSSALSSDKGSDKADKNDKSDKDKADKGKGSEKPAPSPSPSPSPSPLSQNWADYKLSFNCPLTLNGSGAKFQQEYIRIDQPVYVLGNQVSGFITGFSFPSGQSIEIYDDDNGRPGHLLATSDSHNYYGAQGPNGAMCCDDRTFAWYLKAALKTAPGVLYHFVLKPVVPAETSQYFKAAWLSNSNCQDNSKKMEHMMCQDSSGNWSSCDTLGSNPSFFFQDILE